MRLLYIAVFLVFSGLVGQPVFERYMQAAPELIWRVIALVFVGGGVAAAMLSDPIMPLWHGPSASRLAAVLLFALAFGCVGASIGLFIQPTPPP